MSNLTFLEQSSSCGERSGWCEFCKTSLRKDAWPPGLGDQVDVGMLGDK